MSNWPSPFAAAMTDLAALTEAHRRVRERNLSRLAAMVARLDDSASSTSSSVAPSAPTWDSTGPSPTRDQTTASTRPSYDEVILPARTTHGGDYGASIRERVISSYGIDLRR